MSGVGADLDDEAGAVRWWIAPACPKIGQSQPMMAELNESIISAARRAANEAGRTPSTATRS
jgi:hypothetical protein